ncbi:unnamed protein product [Strongylus vulgaris]|uniref:Lipid-binding serum glycoprotein C-terminal domain-containing protein n=1 Tax=Strongylus vulgaris TaxID=40348 RepID=A0A3P7L1W1_STRVU|nr:unnamed protein product [Strongylus vulgaris]
MVAGDGLEPRMIVLWLGESVWNCLLGSIHKSGIIKIPVNKENVPEMESFLRTSCPGSFCVGKFFDMLSKEYPDKHIEMSLHTSDEPYVHMKTDDITVGGQFALDLHVGSIYTTKPLATIILDGTMSVTPSVVEDKLVGKVTNLNFEFKPGPSEIGEISPM